MSKFIRNGLLFTPLIFCAALFYVSPAFCDPQVYVSDEITRHISRYQPDGSQREELFSSFISGNYIGVDDVNQMIYWAASGRVLRCAFDGSGFQTLYDSDDGLVHPIGVAVDPANGFVYWVDSTTNEILRGMLDGSGSKVAIFDQSNGVDKPVGVDIDPQGGKVYWTEQMNGKVFRGNADGSGVPEELHTAPGATDLKLDIPGGTVYWTRNLAHEIVRGNMDGSGGTQVVFDNADGVLSPAGLFVDTTTDMLYWMNAASDIFRGNSNGSGTPSSIYNISLLTTNAQGVGVSTGTDALFITGEAVIFKGLDDGSATLETLLDLRSNLFAPSDFALDLPNNKIYAIEQSGLSFTSGIKRSDLDFGALANQRLTGSVETLFDTTDDGIMQPNGIALDSAAGKIYWTDSGTIKIQRGNVDGSGAVVDLFGVGDGLVDPRNLRIDTAAGRLYWVDFAGMKIQSGAVDGSGAPTSLYTGADGLISPTGLALDLEDGFIYWGDSTLDKIFRGNLDGSGSPVEIVNAADGVNTPREIALDLRNQKLLWTDDDKVFRGNLDGTGTAAALITGMVRSSGIALTPDADGDGVPDEIDGCASDGAKSAPGTCGCGTPDADGNGNGISDCLLNADIKNRIQSLITLVSGLKSTNTGNKKKNKKRNKAQKEAKAQILALANEMKATIEASAGQFNLTDPAADLTKLVTSGRKKALGARKTGSRKFKSKKKQALRALKKLNKALADA